MTTIKSGQKKIKIGVCGCGAIGSRIARSTLQELKDHFRLTGLYDQDHGKTKSLAEHFNDPLLNKNSLSDLLQDCDLMVEAVNQPAARQLVREALEQKRDVLAMSVGRLLDAKDLFALAEKNHCRILIPSGAIAGIDAVKAASLKTISRIVLTTRKPLSGFSDNSYLRAQGIRLDRISGETLIFEGDVTAATRHFPQNINVAATLALACGQKEKLTIRILTSPAFTVNSHEVEITGDFGRMISRTENTVCPDNPKTSYLAVLSAIRTLGDFASGTKFGT